MIQPILTDESTTNINLVSSFSSGGIVNLAVALSKAQGEFDQPTKNQTNPVFRSRYADLASFIDAVRAPLAKHGMAFVNIPELKAINGQLCAGVTTILIHESGEWISSRLMMPVADTKPQSIGSIITYARRYSLASLLNVAAADDDDDGLAGTQQPTTYTVQHPNRQVKPQNMTGNHRAKGANPSPRTKEPVPTPVSVTESQPDAQPQPESVPSPAHSKKDWRETVMHSGPHTGEKLGDIDPGYLNQLYSRWVPERLSPKVQLVFDALKERADELGLPHPQPKTPEPERDQKKG